MKPTPIQRTRNYLSGLAGKTLTPEERCEAAIKLAGYILEAANGIKASIERRQQAQLSRMIDDPTGKAFVVALNDECFRSHDARRIADQICYLLDKYGIPRFLDPLSRLQMFGFRKLGKPLAELSIPLVKAQIRRQTHRVILPAESPYLENHILRRRREGVVTNLNHLGEAILGEAEAAKRLATYIEDLKKPHIEYISVKISTICSQLNTLSYNETLDVLSEPLRLLYGTAKSYPRLRAGGTAAHKFVNLDMEEYRDLRLTSDLFVRVLGEEEFMDFTGGIVLQAYLPDAYGMLEELIAFARERCEKGGAPIKIRLVKGANLLMERVESSTRNWSLAPFSSKVETDANYRKMLHRVLDREVTKAVRVGVASHNLFDLCYALLMIEEQGCHEQVRFEMLEGMADAVRQVICEIAGGMVLYCPVAEADQFESAIAYLIRRLDELTAEENFLRHAFDMEPGNEAFIQQADFFRLGIARIATLDHSPRRKQNRFLPKRKEHTGFRNEADTDFSLCDNIRWAQEAVYAPCRQLLADGLSAIPLVAGAGEILTDRRQTIRSPNSNRDFYEVCLAWDDEIETAIETASKAYTAIEEMKWEERCGKLRRVAQLIREQRGAILAAMIADSGKTLCECDPEISEAIDSCEYYAMSFEQWKQEATLELKGKGVVLVTPPWNFPFAIPVGGVAAALVAGNSVILKPAPETPLVGWKIAQLFYEAGFGREVLQFINCEDEPYGSSLIRDPRIHSVILTGSTETAQLFLRMRPTLDLMAETGGKNCIIVTDMCDRDLAVKHVIDSAFGHAGQKCSACSVLLLEDKLYDDPHFLDLLRDAAASRRVGPGVEPGSVINPLIRPPEGKLLRGLTRLEPGESWLLEPKIDPKNPHLVTPGIRMGVRPDSYTFDTEFFGPVLVVIRYTGLDEAIDIANSSQYGLTGGIISLDEREQQRWIDCIEVGNAYVCRGITGAIVQRQPFGGRKKSAYGRGFKTGGPNYVVQLANVIEKEDPRANTPLNRDLAYLYEQVATMLDPGGKEQFRAACASYQEAWENYFSLDHDSSRIYGQRNLLRYRPHRDLTLVIQARDAAIDIYRILAAARVTGCVPRVLVSPADSERLGLQKLTDALPDWFQLSQVAPAGFARQFSQSPGARNRIIHDAPTEWLHRSAELFVPLQAQPVYSLGRLELLHYVFPTAISIDYHRYGIIQGKDLSVQ